MKITMVNKTHWRSDHIRAFVARCMKDERPDLCKHGVRAMRVTVVYTRRRGSSYSSGCAYLKSNGFTVRLSKHTPDKVDFAHVIAHELAHTRGLNHDMMNSCATYGRVGRWREIYAWAEALPLERVEKKSKKVPVDAKLTHAERMLKSAVTREKRATTLRKKWETKVKYYTKKAAKPPSPPKPKPPSVPPEPKPPQPSLAELVESFGFRLEKIGNNEFEVFTKDGFNMGDGIHSRLCYGVQDVKETVDVYQFMVEPCPDDCECRDQQE